MNKHSSSYSKAQSMLEYLLVMVVVVVIVFVAFRNGGGGVLETTHNKTVQYFNAGSTAIMGGYYDGNTFVRVDPNPINGGWCAPTTCINHVQTQECACPRPAFGGTACPGTGIQGC